MATKYELFLYPVENEFISKITIPVPDRPKPKSNLTTIVILDRSSSMEDQVERFVNHIFPAVFDKLDYPQDEKIYLITFDSVIEKIVTTVKELIKLDVKFRGCTIMAGAVKELQSVLENLGKEQNGIRLLTVSDGEIHDPVETKKYADELMKKVEKKNFDINSQAVRLFTSTFQPDTTALSSLLQLNNVKKVDLLDLNADLGNDDISSGIANLFLNDNMTSQLKLEAPEPIFKKAPWLSDYTSQITLFPGENIFWMSKQPSFQLKIEEEEVKVINKPELDLITYEELLKTKMDYYMTQLKILKVVNTNESTSSINTIVDYFQKRENYILNREEDVQVLLNNPGLRSRMEYLKTMIARRNKTFSMRMAQIANDERVSQLNAAQRADYLRTVENTKLSRGLARRALTQGLDFNETLREEIRTMMQHLDEFDRIDDKNHEESFYSRAKTTDGLRAIIDLAKDDLLDDLDANDILLMVNIVGIPCTSPIGDYPDPMTWRIFELHYGWYLSLSDLLTAFVQNGETFKTPATNKEINNIIPLFEDESLIRFLRKYAPSLVEYTASIGMRRVIADVPMTCSYTICAAIWKMIEDLNKTKSELHLKTFKRLLLNYELYVGGYFKYILPFIKEQNNGRLSYYIGNNGITNMISPLITIFRENNAEKLKHIPQILRALYTYEVWQAIRRSYKNRDNSDAIIEEMLTKLLGIDKEKNKTKLAPLYEVDPKMETIAFWDTPVVNQSYLKELCKSFYYADFVALIPKYFSAVLTDQVEKISAVPSLNEDLITQELDLPYKLADFKLYNIVQALLFTTKSSRVADPSSDEVEAKMKISDLRFEEEGRKMMKDYIRKQFEQIYLSDLAEKKKTEEVNMAAMLVQSIIQSTTPANVVNLFQNGVKQGQIEYKFKNSSTLGISDLKRRLLDPTESISLRCDIIRIFLLGRDLDDTPVWNQGNVNFVYHLKDFAKIFEEGGRSAEWEDVLADYKKRGVHTYREKVNYHGHGNQKPSYYAFGYPSLQHYKNDVSKEDFEKYCDIHNDCCGVSKLLELLKRAQV